MQSEACTKGSLYVFLHTVCEIADICVVASAMVQWSFTDSCQGITEVVIIYQAINDRRRASSETVSLGDTTKEWYQLPVDMLQDGEKYVVEVSITIGVHV